MQAYYYSQKALVPGSVFKIFIHLEFRPFPQASITNFTPSHGTQTFWVFLTVCTHAPPNARTQTVYALLSCLQLLCI